MKALILSLLTLCTLAQAQHRDAFSDFQQVLLSISQDSIKEGTVKDLGNSKFAQYLKSLANYSEVKPTLIALIGNSDGNHSLTAAIIRVESRLNQSVSITHIIDWVEFTEIGSIKFAKVSIN